ncbi:MAG: hypothetical protein ACK2U3_09305, partial [Anaerolineales bacterium]
MKKIIVLIFAEILTVLLLGCSSIEKIEQPTITGTVILDQDNTVGQTFVARYDGLDGILFNFEPSPDTQGEITLTLTPGPDEKEIIRKAILELPSNSLPGHYHIQFEPLNESTKEYYYSYLEFNGTGTIKVGHGNGDAYLNGAVYQNHSPMDAQATFNLSYDPTQVALGLLQEGLYWILWLLVGIFLYILPGWGLLGLLWPSWKDYHWSLKLGLSAGVSLAIYPILFLWTYIIGLNLGAFYAWLPPIAGLLLIIWNNRLNLHQRKSPFSMNLKPFPWAGFTLLVVIGLVFAVRFWVIRGLEAPMWGDSYQHTMIAQLLVDNKGLFQSWEPYVPYQSLTVHFGFHTQLAVFMWLIGYNSLPSTLIVGQIINGLAIITLFPLTYKLNRKNIWAGTGGLIIGGLISQLPAFYVNWGRYAQLAGLVILPGASWMVVDLIDQKVHII